MLILWPVLRNANGGSPLDINRLRMYLYMYVHMHRTILKDLVGRGPREPQPWVSNCATHIHTLLVRDSVTSSQKI